MFIEISNFRNIDSLKYEIEDQKVNFLFGVCGSGKSSLLDAISTPIGEQDIAVGKKLEDVSVTVNGNPPLFENTAIYNANKQSVLFSSGETHSSYDIFIGDADILTKLENNYNDAIGQLRSHQESLYAYCGQIESLSKQIGKPPKNGFTDKSKLSKATNALHNVRPRAKKAVESQSFDYLSWLARGFEVSNFYDNGVCPFCGMTLNDEAVARLQEIKELNASSIKPLFQSSTLLADLGIAQPNYENEEEIESLKQAIFDLFRIRDNIQEVLALCQRARSLNTVNTEIKPLVLLNETKKRFPDIVQIADEINRNSTKLKKLIGQMKTEFAKIINSNAKAINTQLKSLGIPYSFAIEDADRAGKKASYKLCHIKGGTETDMREALSTGEKNLVALLLFLHRQDKEVILIDDPASSYDDYRRSQLFELILSNKKSTVLVVSHDQCFVRRAARASNKPRIGKIQQLIQSPEGIRVEDIDRSSFGSFDDFILETIRNATTYYRTALNLRLYVDIHKEEFSDSVWGYTSAILHETDFITLQELISASGKTEEEIVEEIESITGVRIEKYPGNFDTDTSNFSHFEQLVAIREKLKRQKSDDADDKRIIEMLNDLVHMNDAMLFCLNPYKYDVWAPSLNELLSS